MYKSLEKKSYLAYNKRVFSFMWEIANLGAMNETK